MVNKEFVKKKNSLVQDEMADLEKLSQYSFREIISDFMKKNTLEGILERIVMRVVDVNQHLIAELASKGGKLC